jgi:hypothetical protein
MERHCKALIIECILDFQCTCLVIPDHYILILTACYNKLFADTDIESSYLSLVVLAIYIIELSVDRLAVEISNVHRSFEHLAVVCHDVNSVFVFVDSHRLDLDAIY